MLLVEQRDGQRFAPSQNGVWRRLVASIVHKKNFETGIALLQAERLKASIQNRPIVENGYNDAKERRRFGCTIGSHLMIAENLTYCRLMRSILESAASMEATPSRGIND
jgi:hypothetical protein